MEKMIVRKNRLLQALQRHVRGRGVVTIEYERVNPVCSSCWRMDKELKRGKDEICTRCGGRIEFDAETECKISKIKNGVVVYKTMEHKAPRMCRVENIFHFVDEDVELFVVKD